MLESAPEFVKAGKGSTIELSTTEESAVDLEVF